MFLIIELYGGGRTPTILTIGNVTYIISKDETLRRRRRTIYFPPLEMRVIAPPTEST